MKTHLFGFRAVFAILTVTQAGDLRVMTNRSFYTDETSARLIVLDTPAAPAGSDWMVRVRHGDRVMHEAPLDLRTKYPTVEFAVGVGAGCHALPFQEICRSASHSRHTRCAADRRAQHWTLME